MTAYLVLTSPWGSGESEGGGTRGSGAPRVAARDDIAADQSGAIQAIGRASAHTTMLSPDQVRTEYRDLLDPNYRPRKNALEGVMQRGRS